MAVDRKVRVAGLLRYGPGPMQCAVATLIGEYSAAAMGAVELCLHELAGRRRAVLRSDVLVESDLNAFW